MNVLYEFISLSTKALLVRAFLACKENLGVRGGEGELEMGVLAGKCRWRRLAMVTLVLATNLKLRLFYL